MDLDPALLKELVMTFNTELDEQLQVITDGLLYLEKNNQRNNSFTNKIGAIFRAAHNIKGAAKGLGIDSIGDISHHVESIFANIKNNSSSLSKTTISICLEAVDNMRLAMRSYLEQKPLPFKLDAFLSRLSQGANETPKNYTTKKIKNEDLDRADIILNTEHETIRISVDHLDQVSALVDEMQVSKISIEEYYRDLTNINTKFQNLAHDWKKSESTLKSGEIDNIQKIYTNNTDIILEISESIRQLYNTMRPRINELSILSNSLQEEVRLLRLVPASTLLRSFPRIVRDLANELGKKVELKIIGEEVKMDKLILEGLKDPLTHILRNAIDHGIEYPEKRIELGKADTGNILIQLHEEGNHIYINISDDGIGIDVDKIDAVAEAKKLLTQAELATMSEDDKLELLFRPGFSTKDIITDVSGRGVGLDVVKENLEKLKGNAAINTVVGEGTTFVLRVPLTLSSEHGLMVKCAGQSFALLASSVERVLILKTTDIVDVSATQAILLDGHPIVLRLLSDILGYPKPQTTIDDSHHVVVIKKDKSTVALLVDEIIGEREMVIKPLQPPLTDALCTSGGTLSGNGEIVIVLNTPDLISIALQSKNINRVTFKMDAAKNTVKPHILVVDDSITTRTMEKNILESKNYMVTVAVNGKEAWDILQKQKFSLLITDVSMPIMDGFTLTERIKNSELREMPVIIVTSLDSAAEKKRGIDVGANAYIVKNDFESNKLLEIVSQLVYT